MSSAVIPATRRTTTGMAAVVKSVSTIVRQRAANTDWSSPATVCATRAGPPDAGAWFPQARTFGLGQGQGVAEGTDLLPEHAHGLAKRHELRAGHRRPRGDRGADASHFLKACDRTLVSGEQSGPADRFGAQQGLSRPPRVAAVPARTGVVDDRLRHPDRCGDRLERLAGAVIEIQVRERERREFEISFGAGAVD